MDYPQTVQEKILSAPDAPGVYLMRDCSGQVLYVGKANSLKKRLLNYLGQDLTCKTQILMAKVADVEFRLAPNEAMALLLEFKLIHEFKPRYNVSLKDDKSFPFVRISHEAFPSIQVTRKKNNDAASRYLGPYTNTKLLKSALKIIRLSLLIVHASAFLNKVAFTMKLIFVQRPVSVRLVKKNISSALPILF
ncbi:MAG: GIY-YIG nuclease family protein [Candidatus Omnitrophota bacterium]